MSNASIRFEAESLFHLKPRRQLNKWLAGDDVKCPVCNQFVTEGNDCTNQDYDRVGLALRSVIKQMNQERDKEAGQPS